MTGQASVLVDRWSMVAGLRWWVQGVPADEAAVELLAGLGARFTSSHCPWVRPCGRPGWYWLDADPLARFSGRLSGSERRVLALVVTLLGGQPSLAPLESASPGALLLTGAAA